MVAKKAVTDPAKSKNRPQKAAIAAKNDASVSYLEKNTVLPSSSINKKSSSDKNNSRKTGKTTCCTTEKDLKKHNYSNLSNTKVKNSAQMNKKPTTDKNAINTGSPDSRNKGIESKEFSSKTHSKSNSRVFKTNLNESNKNINQLKQKTNREIFQKCLEKKLLHGGESWDESDTSDEENIDR